MPLSSDGKEYLRNSELGRAAYWEDNRALETQLMQEFANLAEHISRLYEQNRALQAQIEVLKKQIELPIFKIE